MKKYVGANLLKDVRTAEQKLLFADYDVMMKRLMEKQNESR